MEEKVKMKAQIFKRLSLIVLAMLLCATLAVAVLVPTALAYKSSDITNGANGIKKIGEIFKEDATTGGTFDKNNLEALVEALRQASSAQKGATLEASVLNLRNAVDNGAGTTTAGGESYSDTLRVQNQAIIVEFGGIQWFAAFLSLADTKLDSSTYNGIGNKPTENTGAEGNGTDLILTLWQATPTESSTWVDPSKASSYGNSDSDSQGTSPANMYGTSYVRAVALNNGGVYATSKNDSTYTSSTQSESSPYAKFTMEEYSGQKSNIPGFLVAPRFVSWQQSQVIPNNWNWTEKGCALNNQAWGTMGKNKYYQQAVNRPYYEDYTNYRQWKDDLLWLPSCAEVGNTYQSVQNEGIWGLTQDQRRFNEASASEYLWLRSGSTGNYYSAYGLTADGVFGAAATSASRLVRPALHLNLTSAAQAANTVDKPTAEQNKTVVYNGSAQTFETGVETALVDNKVTIETKKDGQNVGTVTTTNQGGKQVLSVTEAGVYTVTVTPKEGYRWDDGDPESNDRTPFVFTFTIEKRKVGIEVINPGPSSVVYGVTYPLEASNVSKYWKYTTDSPNSGNDYSAGAYYTILPQDLTKLSVSTPATSGSGAVGVGKYPLILSLGDLANDSNYDITLTGDFQSDSGSYSMYNGAAATVKVEKRRVSVNVAIPANQASTLVYGSTFNLTAASDYYSYVSGTITANAESSTDYLPSNYYQFLASDVNLITVATPASSASAFVAPGKYPLYLNLGTLENSNNYDITVTGDFNDDSGSFAMHNGKAATVTVNKREVIIDVKTPSGQAASFVYGTVINLSSSARSYWEYAAGTPYQLLAADESKFTITTEATNPNQIPGRYPITLAFTGDLSNYILTINGNNLTVEITPATLDVSALTWELSETYAFDANGQPVKYAMKIDESRIGHQGNVDVKVTYGALVGSNGSISKDDSGAYLISKAGSYSVTVTIEALHHETVTRTLYMTVNKATAVINLIYDKTGEIWTSGLLPELSCTAFVGNHPVEGTIRWTTSLGVVTQDGPFDFGWQWIPLDENIENASATERISVRFAAVRGIAIDFEPGDRVFYESDPLSDLKNYLTVTVTFTDGKTRVLGMNEYDLSCLGESSLVAGDNVLVTISYLSAGSPVTQSFNVNVLAVEKPGIDPPDVNPGDEPGENLWTKVMDWFDETPLPLGYACLVLGGELFIIIILAIAARKPKRK